MDSSNCPTWLSCPTNRELGSVIDCMLVDGLHGQGESGHNFIAREPVNEWLSLGGWIRVRARVRVGIGSGGLLLGLELHWNRDTS